MVGQALQGFTVDRNKENLNLFINLLLIYLFFIILIIINIII